MQITADKAALMSIWAHIIAKKLKYSRAPARVAGAAVCFKTTFLIIHGVILRRVPSWFKFLTASSLKAERTDSGTQHSSLASLG